MEFTRDSILIDPEKTVVSIAEKIKRVVMHTFKRKGGVIGISGGIDSAVVLAISARALGANNITGVMMPEKDSDESSLRLAGMVARQFGISYEIENITPVLEGYRCYERRDEAVRRIFPDYEKNDKIKITLPGNLLESNNLNFFTLTCEKSDGSVFKKRIPPSEYLQIVAASNLKQRTRMSLLYYHAEKRNYIVMGTGNKNEHDLGFFVKYGDGAADIQPVLHLFKTQIYQLARYLDIPGEIIERTPTSDTYSADQSQEEFFFRLPFGILDRVWYGLEKNIPVPDIARVLDLEVGQIERIIRDIIIKKKTTEFLRNLPVRVS